VGGNFNGCRIGFDLGASDRKVSAVIDGEAVYTEEVDWDPRGNSDPEYHYSEMRKMLKSAAEHLPRVDAIGGSSAGVFINNRPRVASLFRGIPKDKFESKIADMFLNLQKEWGDVPMTVLNDGEVTALVGADSLGATGVLGVAMGSSEAGGYVTPDGALTNWLNELAFCPVDYNPDAPLAGWSGDRGCGALYFSQQAVFRLADKVKRPIAPAKELAAKLAEIQEFLKAGDDRAVKIWETIGVYLGYTVAHYADFYDLNHVLILGRVTSYEGGNILIRKAREVLEVEFPELAERITLSLPDEKARRVGQAVMAAGLPEC
jgi:predicted NBD/HSP70 family sugar kinase